MEIAQPPVLLPITVEEGPARGLAYRIEGELVPVLPVVLDGNRSAFFEHHIVLWKDPNLLTGMHPDGRCVQAGGGRDAELHDRDAIPARDRVPSRRSGAHGVARPADRPFDLRARAPVAGGDRSIEPRRRPGHRRHVHLCAGNREHAVRRHRAHHRPLPGRRRGGPGLAPQPRQRRREGARAGESVEVEVEGGAWVHRDGTVSMQPAIYGPTTGVFCGSGQLVFNRFTGPGGVGIQSAYVHLPTED